MADRNAKDAISGADPAIEDDLAAREKELLKITQEQGDAGVPPNPDEKEDEVENPENLVAQASDPEAQES